MRWLVRLTLYPVIIGFTAFMLLNAYWNRVGDLKQPKLPMVYFVSESQPDEGKAAAALAADVWNKAVGKDIIEIRYENVPDRNRNNIFFSNNQRVDMGQNRLGTTMVTPSLLPVGYIAEADIYIPDFIRTFSLSETCYSWNEVDKYDLVRVLAHEMGHGLGLPHFDFTQSLMNSILDKTYLETVMTGKDVLEFAKPTQFDVEKIKQKYPEYFNAKK